MKKFIKYMHSSLDNASRNKRELSVVAQFDCEIVVCTFGNEECVKTVDGYTVYQRTKNLSKNSLVRKLQILYNWFIKEPQYLRHQNADCISCHDLVALLIGWLSTWFMGGEKKPLLVYDSHEFEIGRNRDGKRGEFAKYMIPKVEKFLMKKCAFSIMVNDSIADEVQRIHKLKERPIVVRNIPNIWQINHEICQQNRIEICKELSLPHDTFLLMYHGGISKGRGIGQVIQALPKLEQVAFIVLGYGEDKECYALSVQQLGVGDQVLFLDAVPSGQLWKYIGAADLSICIIENVCESYYLSLPNKLFEAIQSETPIIGSDFPEIARIINKYDIGLLVDPENVEEIVSAIEKVRKEKALYNKYKNNLRHAKEELCWENEQKVLKEVYAKILS